MYTVDEFMITDVHTLSPEDALCDAQNLMIEKNVRHLPVIDKEQRLVGLITHSDVLAATESILNKANFDKASRGQNSQDSTERAGSGATCLSHKVAEVMTTKLKVIEPKGSLRNAAIHLQKFRHGCLPVVNDKKLIGIITDSDFVSIAINLIEQLEDAEPYDDDDF